MSLLASGWIVVVLSINLRCVSIKSSAYLWSVGPQRKDAVRRQTSQLIFNLLSGASVSVLKNWIAGFKQPKLILMKCADWTHPHIPDLSCQGGAERSHFALSCWKGPAEVVWASDKNASYYGCFGQVRVDTEPEHTTGIRNHLVRDVWGEGCLRYLA